MFRFNLKIIGLQPSVLLNNGFFQCITILSKQTIPEHLAIGISFVFTESSCSNIDVIEGRVEVPEDYKVYIIVEEKRNIKPISQLHS